MRTILLLHGPNLNLLGKRDAKHYGNITLSQLETLTKHELARFNAHLIHYQSNHEGDLIDKIQEVTSSISGLIVNLGAFTHYSYALHDALLDTGLPYVEVHLSDLSAREKWRQHSVIAESAIKVISGKREAGYIEAVNVLMEKLNNA